MEKEWYSSKEVQSILKINSKRLQYLRKSGMLPFKKIAKKTIIYKKSDVDTLFQKGYINDNYFLNQLELMIKESILKEESKNILFRALEEVRKLE